MFDGKYCKIVNRFTGKIIAAGKVVNHKDIPIKCISFDDKHFFNLNKKILYKFIFCDYCDEVKFDNIKYKNKIMLWRYVYKCKSSFVYRDYDITELDEEIKDLVFAINKINLRTVSSCCGHGVLPAWIYICFENFNDIRKMLDILSSKDFNNKFVLTTDEYIINKDRSEIFLALKTVKIGKEAYKDINELSKYIKILSEL